MKYLILFFSVNLFAGAWMSEEHVLLKNNNQRGAKSYGTEASCIKNHVVCCNIVNKPPRYHTCNNSVIVFNQTLKDEYDYLMQTKENEKIIRIENEVDLVIRLKSCRQDLRNSPTPARRNQCTLLLLRFAIREELETIDL